MTGEDAGRRWPWGVGVVLGLTVAGNAAVYWAANDADAAAVEPDYYRKAVEWDSTMAQTARNQALGWTAAAELGPPTASGRRDVSVRLTDAAGRPIPAARIELTAIHNSFAATPVHAESLTDSAGTSLLRAQLSHEGLWELRLVVTRGGDRYTSTQRRDTGSSSSFP